MNDLIDVLLGVALALAVVALPAAFVGAVIAEYELLRREWPHNPRWRCAHAAVGNVVDVLTEHLPRPSRRAAEPLPLVSTPCECSACQAAQRSDDAIAATVDRMMGRDEEGPR